MSAAATRWIPPFWGTVQTLPVPDADDVFWVNMASSPDDPIGIPDLGPLSIQ